MGSREKEPGFSGEPSRLPLPLAAGQREVWLRGKLCPRPPCACPVSVSQMPAGMWLLENAKGLGKVSTTAFGGDTDQRSRV